MVRRGRAATLAASLLLSTSGCTPLSQYVHQHFKVGPDYARPPAPVAQDWIDAADPRVKTETPDLSEWWEVFDDPALSGLMRAAYNQNLSLREAGFRVLEARAELGIAVGNLFPQSQSADGGYTNSTLSTAVANRQFIPDRYFGQYSLGFGLAWELDFWGRYRRAIESADAQFDASVENYDAVLVTLLGDVGFHYTRLRTLQQELRYVEANVALQEESLSIAKARFQGGSTSELDVDQAASILAQTQALVPQLEILIRHANNRLCVLLGIPPEDLAKILGNAAIPTAPPEVAVGLPANLLTQRPDVRRAEREAAAQCAHIGVAVSELYPHISISGTIGYTAEDVTNLFTQEASRGTIGPAFQWNLLNYGRLLNNVRAKEARFQALVANYQNTVLKANEEAENGLVIFLKAQRRAAAYKDSVEAAEKAVKVAIAQYKGGLVDFNRVAFLEQNLVQQQNEYATALGEIALGLIDLYRALGGGWEIRLGTEAELAAAAPTESPTPGAGQESALAPTDEPNVPLPSPLPSAPTPKPAPLPAKPEAP